MLQLKLVKKLNPGSVSENQQECVGNTSYFRVTLPDAAYRHTSFEEDLCRHKHSSLLLSFFWLLKQFKAYRSYSSNRLY